VLRARLDAIKESWRLGTPADACAALSADAELRANKPALLDLAYEEFRIRVEAGEEVDVEAFCERFPAFRTSLRRELKFNSIISELKESLAVPTGEAGGRLRQPPQPQRWPQTGEIVGDLLLLRELGRGAFARVFLAAEESTGDRLVAVKLSLEGGDEARTLGRMAHPNVVPVLSCRRDLETGLTMVCMPFLGSATLEDVLDWRQSRSDKTPRAAGELLEAVRAAAGPEDTLAAVDATVDERLQRGSYTAGVLHLGAQLAGALAFLHAAGVLHRDLKPSNVLLGPDGRPRLLDFNLAVGLERHGAPVGGTLAYSAPEQIKTMLGQDPGAPPDGRSDVYALAVILHELLTGRHPFGPLVGGLPPEELGPMLLERQQAGGSRLRVDDLDPAATRLLERCLAFDPQDRPASAAELMDGLRAYFHRRRRLRRWIGRHRWAILAVAACLVVGVLATPWPSFKPQTSAYGRGRDAFNAGRYDEALEDFSQAVGATPEDPRYRFAHACALMKRAAASTGRQAADLRSAARIEFQMPQGDPHEGLAHLCAAYCSAHEGDHGLALAHIDRAVQAGYPSTVVVYNNRAYSYIQRKRLDEAAAALTAIMPEDCKLAAVRCNRARLALEYRLSHPETPLHPSALEDVCTAARAEPTPAYLLLYAAYLHALAVKDAPLMAGSAALRDRDGAMGVNFLRRALEQGVDSGSLANKCLDSLRDRADFQTLLRNPPKRQAQAQETIALIDPISTLPD
jgi:tetratricopeptide (TPR) repeat protein